MTATIHYESDDGTETLRRGEWHTDNDGFVTAFWNPDDEPGTFEVIHIPTRRVVMIEEE